MIIPWGCTNSPGSYNFFEVSRCRLIYLVYEIVCQIIYVIDISIPFKCNSRTDGVRVYTMWDYDEKPGLCDSCKRANSLSIIPQTNIVSEKFYSLRVAYAYSKQPLSSWLIVIHIKNALLCRSEFINSNPWTDRKIQIQIKMISKFHVWTVITMKVMTTIFCWDGSSKRI